jgi:chemotaxis protein methyltransferase CheR
VGNVTTSKEFMMMQRFIEDRCGIFSGEEKTYLLESKLTKMLSESSFGSLEELCAKICHWNDPKLIDNIIDAITVNETFWFRDKTPWLIMEDILLPNYINEFREGKRDRVRIWSSACSYGQEPYSTAMCIDHYLKSHNIHDINLSHFEILATDISRTVLRAAHLGKYDNISIGRGLDDAYRFEYFKNEGRVWGISDKIRIAVRFQQLNLLKEFFPCEKFDIIFLRNVLIYFSDKQKKEMMGKIKDALRPGGTLFIGSSELLTDHNLNFSIAQHKNGIYFRKQE